MKSSFTHEMKNKKYHTVRTFPKSWSLMCRDRGTL